jgi:hypothetical protein
MAAVLLCHKAYIDVPPTATELGALEGATVVRLAHLRRSNEELAMALAETPGDAEFSAAIAENEDVIGQLEARVVELRELVAALRAAARARRPVAFVPEAQWRDVTGREGEGHVVVGLRDAEGPAATAPAAGDAGAAAPAGGMLL